MISATRYNFTEGISRTIRHAVAKLKPGKPFAFTYHHNQLDAYIPMAVAILDAGLVASASLPCPAEMGASIHINGTGSSVVDTVFVCRSTGSFPKRWLASDAVGVAGIVKRDIDELAAGGLKATQGDIRCVSYGHLTRLAIWHLRTKWDMKRPVKERMKEVQDWLAAFGGVGAVLTSLEKTYSQAQSEQKWLMSGMVEESIEREDKVSF